MESNSLSQSHAIKQESWLHQKANKSTYRNLATNALASLKKTLPFLNQHEITKDWFILQPSLSLPWKLNEHQIASFIAQKDQLEELGYPLELNQTSERILDYNGIKKLCCRCSESFVVRQELDDEQKYACHYHFGRLRTTSINGKV